MTLSLRVSTRRGLALAAAAALALAVAACGDDAPPKKRPPDLAVRYSWDLSPADVTGRLDIAKGEATYADTRGDNKVRFTFTPAAAQLDALWKALRSNRVDTIETEERAPDLRKSVESLRVRWGDREIAVTDGVKVRVKPEDTARWRKIQLALRALIMAERRKRGLPED